MRKRRGGLPRAAAMAALAALTALVAPVSASAEAGDSAGNWPSFRGPGASGVADGLGLPERWNGETGEHIRFRVPIPGLAHSSPVVWGEKVCLTSVVSSAGDASFQHGLYGSGEASGDTSRQRWIVLCLDKDSGDLLWLRTATAGVSRDKRHLKATYANSTPATDGRRLVALFGSEGLFAYDLEGQLLWSRDLGRMDAGAYNAPDYEWGSASSPILWQDRVILQVDTQGEDFLLALDAATGETLWRTPREETPSWGTPTVVPAAVTGGAPELVTNASRFIRSYDPATGEELWRLGGSSEITAPTPIYGQGLIYVASGRRPEKPIFALRPSFRGDLTLAEGETSSEAVAWSWTRRGSYMPTPLLYRGHLYVLENQGILGCYNAATGEELYRERIPHSGGGFSASPVASDGWIYLPGEDGDIFVIQAGPSFELLAVNPVGELLMATPALSDGTLYVRGKSSLFAISR